MSERNHENNGNGLVESALPGESATARATGLGQTLSLLIASQLLVGLLVDRVGLFGAAVQDLSPLKVLGAALILVGGVLVVRF